MGDLLLLTNVKNVQDLTTRVHAMADISKRDITALNEYEGGMRLLKEKEAPAVLHSGDARAILLRLEPEQILGDHEVRERAWLTVVEGEIEVTCGEARSTVGAGTLVMFDPGERHSVSSAAGARVLLLLAPWPADGHYGAEESSQQAT